MSSQLVAPQHPQQTPPYSPGISSIAEVNALLKVRHDIPTEQLCAHIRSNFHGNINSLKILEPFVREVLRRFKHLPRKKNVDGTRPSIDGCTSFKKWCETVLHKTDRTVRYMLSGGNKKQMNKTGKSISAVQERASAYLEKQLKPFKHPDQREIASHLVEYLQEEILSK